MVCNSQKLVPGPQKSSKPLSRVSPRVQVSHDAAVFLAFIDNPCPLFYSGGTMKLPFALQEDEQVVKVVRRHWLHLYPRLIGLLFIALVPVALFWLVVWTTLTLDTTLRWLLIAGSATWLLFWAVRLYLLAYRYNNDIWVITDQRIIDSVRTHPFSLRIETADLVNVQNLAINRTGLLRTLFDYGDVACETAGETGKFTLAGVPNPRDVQLLIDRLRDAQRARNPL